ncbi:MaoC family dehydratase N-terminal domain-containing protein [Nocardioides sp. LMS-CY]|uniref:FAS1-like dehydratase domain-containing protein n=1 Tax=Nocardioides sp. (strain LMS-CY) TaxID=2840457 RepID=UPI001C005496|nr:MaoC family dehydratase N-terminal domain-containing protein [Nocardioides sp. LMS-CY]QWF20847.1 MaoC family dehydratase N-terminal domain-containing protein [Nocardioides sp. LMS-CY]
MTLLTDEVRALVGRTATYTAPEPLGRAAIRYFALATGDDNPAHLAGDVAPPTLVCETNQFVNLPRDENGFAGHGWDFHLPGTREVRGGNSYRFHRPVRPDDVVTATWTVTDVAERTTGSGDGMVVVTSLATYTDQAGELLVENEETLIYVEVQP